MIERERVRGIDEAVEDTQTVTSDGESVQEPIHGVRVRHTPTQADERGDLSEIYDERWEFTLDPVSFVYMVTLRPGSVRGWIVHLEQDDRLFFGAGTAKVALYDAREDSPTFERVNVFFFGTHDRALLRIPAGVFHAVKNVGASDATFVNLPTLPYRHANPDKYRLPVDSEAVPLPDLKRAAWQARLAAAIPQLVWNAHVHPTPRRTPLVSVVIATYNWSSVLRHAVRSALRQTYPSIEVIVVGDACTDDSEAVVRSLGDPRVRWDNLAQNSGSQSLPNNRGLKLARGEYVAYLGHDDLWLPTHLVHLAAALERSGAGLVAGSAAMVGPPGSNVRAMSGFPIVVPSAALHRRDVIETVGGWRDYRTIVALPDFEFFERVAARHGVAYSRALTVCKFNSAWRQDSYRTRRDDEQREYAGRIERERAFVERELLAYLWLRFRRVRQALPPVAPVPEVVPPGWQVTQWRRARGLPDEPGGPDDVVSP